MNRTSRIVLASIVFVGCATLAACDHNRADNGNAAVSAAPINKLCPKSGETANPNIYSTFDGKKIAFCCAGCKAQFESMNADGKRGWMAKAK